ncbi:MAG: glycosyltransferase family 2 protein [Gemmatimonadales bacterium]
MLYITIPSYNEAPTVGVLLWRIRKVFQDYSREYEVIVFDDASTDGTREALEPYVKVMPLTVMGSEHRVGYARAVETLLRAASERTRYPRRDAVVLMQADFTDQPEHLPELVKRFEGGADVVAVERVVGPKTPVVVRKLSKLIRWLPAVWPIRALVTVPGVKDPFAGLRLLRITVVRDLLQERGSTVPADASVPAVNVELTRAAVRLARRVETVALEPRWDLRQRESRVQPWPDAYTLLRHFWRSRPGRTPSVAE